MVDTGVWSKCFIGRYLDTFSSDINGWYYSYGHKLLQEMRSMKFNEVSQELIDIFSGMTVERYFSYAYVQRIIKDHHSNLLK